MTKPFGPPNVDDGRDDERADICECDDREKDSYIHHGEWDEIFHYCITCGGTIEE